MPAEYEVRITPLLIGQAGVFEDEAGGTSEIEIGETTLVEQFGDLEVPLDINESPTASVTLSIHDPIVADLEPFEQALWIGYKRPDEEDAEPIFWAQCNVVTDYEAGTVRLVADAMLRAKHHYVRRGDDALKGTLPDGEIDEDLHADRAYLPTDGNGVERALDAARNTIEQQDRGVPAFGAYVDGTFVAAGLPIGVERGQECWSLIQEIVRSVNGPDMVIAYRSTAQFPLDDRAYCALELWDPPGDPLALDPNMLGSNRDPDDPDDPQPGEVIWGYGYPEDNLEEFVDTPERPTTHCHVVDSDRFYRVTSADADSSERCGIFVDWIEADITVKRALNPNLDVLQAIADARVKAYGEPPRHVTIRLRPDDVQTRHFGHPWIEPTNWYLGDYVRVRARARKQTAEGWVTTRAFSQLMRITGVTFRQESTNGLPQLDVRLVPAVGGVPGVDPEDSDGS